MRNRFPGTCYRCGDRCEAGAGHFEKVPNTANRWRVQHASCAIKYRGTDYRYDTLSTVVPKEDAERIAADKGYPIASSITLLT